MNGVADLAVPLLVLVLTSAISFIDTKVTFVAGMVWLWAGLTIFAGYHVAYFLMAAGIGMYFIIKGVWEYFPD